MATTPNMSLVLPVVSTTIGPTYATMQNTADTVIDAHDHTFGKGVRIPPSGLDISSELAFGGNAAVELQSTQFESQTTALTGLTASLYFLNGDLYAIDGDGTSVRVTENGSLSAAGTGTIAGLPSGTASAAFSASTFTFKASTNRYATMAGGPASLRRGDEDTPNAITLLPAASTATQTLTLPAALPAASAFVTVDASGNFGYSPALSLGITRAMQAAVGQITSTATVGVVKNNTSDAVYETLTLSITTTGRPVIVGLLTPSGTDFGFFGAGNASGVAQSIRWYFDVDGAAGKHGASYIQLAATTGTAFLPLASVGAFIPGLSAGAHTITLYAYSSNASTTYGFFYAQLFAYEM